MSSADYVVKSWYDEIHDPGYNFSKSGYQAGTGHFTQVIWKSTTEVGMAVSQDGKYIVANYLPPGNIVDIGSFEVNVLAGDSDIQDWIELPVGKPNPKAKPDLDVSATSMTPEMLEAFRWAGSFDREEFKEKAQEAFAQGKMVRVTKTEDGTEDGMNWRTFIMEIDGIQHTATWGAS